MASLCAQVRSLEVKESLSLTLVLWLTGGHFPRDSESPVRPAALKSRAPLGHPVLWAGTSCPSPEPARLRESCLIQLSQERFIQSPVGQNQLSISAGPPLGPGTNKCFSCIISKPLSPSPRGGPVTPVFLRGSGGRHGEVKSELGIGCISCASVASAPLLSTRCLAARCVSATPSTLKLTPPQPHPRVRGWLPNSRLRAWRTQTTCMEEVRSQRDET